MSGRGNRGGGAGGRARGGQARGAGGPPPPSQGRGGAGGGRGRGNVGTSGYAAPTPPSSYVSPATPAPTQPSIPVSRGSPSTSTSLSADFQQKLALGSPAPAVAPVMQQPSRQAAAAAQTAQSTPISSKALSIPMRPGHGTVWKEVLG